LGHVAAVAGGEDDGVEVENAAVGNLNLAALGEALDGGDDGDVARPDARECAVVEHWGAAVCLLEL
jgi:hypothetical protein